VNTQRLRLALGALALVGLPACTGGHHRPPTPPASPPGTVPRTDTADVGDDGLGASYGPTGGILADNGFRPDSNGFSFGNNGNDPGIKNLGAAEMRQLFGDGVCADTATGGCDLIPTAQRWMDQRNLGLDGGHCFGMAIGSQLIYRGAVSPVDLGAPDVPQLSIVNNSLLQPFLAANSVKQYLDAVNGAQVKGTPAQILDAVVDALKTNKADTAYGVLIYKVDPATGVRWGGHEVTPYAVEDRGGGVANILVYDNNYPKVTHAIAVNRTANTWSYTPVSRPGDPDVYSGDAKTASLALDVVPISLAPQPCPFCTRDPSVPPDQAQPPAGGATGAALSPAKADASDASGAASGIVLAGFHHQVAPATPVAPGQTNEFSLSGSDGNHAHLILTDTAGRHTGVVGGRFTADIPGVSVVFPRGDDSYLRPEPVFRVPDSLQVTAAIDGSGLTKPDTETLSLIGPGVDLAVQDVVVQPGDLDLFTPSADGTRLRYQSARAEPATFLLGAVGKGVDYSFAFAGLGLARGEEINLKLNADTLQVDSQGARSPATYALTMTRLDDKGPQQFTHGGITLEPGGSAVLQFGAFNTSGDAVPLVTKHADGKQDTVPLADSAK
jgi:hypothetical protein